MQTEFAPAFLRDLDTLPKKIRNRTLSIIERVSSATSPLEIPHLKKLEGNRIYYRIRIGNYRIGIRFESDTAVFLSCLHRRDIYRFFP